MGRVGRFHVAQRRQRPIRQPNENQAVTRHSAHGMGELAASAYREPRLAFDGVSGRDNGTREEAA